jgi:hypothetical protein
MSPDILSPGPKILWSNFINDLRVAVAETVNSSPTDQISPIVFHVLEVRCLCRLFNIPQALAALIMVGAAKVGNRRKKIRAITLHHELIHESQMAM